MGTKSTSIFHGERDQDVRATVRRRCNGVARGGVSLEFLSSACFAANPGMEATFCRTVFVYTVITTVSMTKCLPCAKKSRATTSHDMERFATRRSLASTTTTDASGTPASFRIDVINPTNPTCRKVSHAPIRALDDMSLQGHLCSR